MLAELVAFGPEEPGPFSWADPARVHRILEGAGFGEVSLTALDPEIQLAGPKGEAEAADFVMAMGGPLVRVLPSLSVAERQNVRATLEVYFRGHAASQGVVLPAVICRDTREGKLLRQECLGARPAVSRAPCRCRSTGILQRQGAAKCYHGVLRGMSNLVRGSISVFLLSLCLSRVVKTGAGQFASKAHTDPIEPRPAKGRGSGASDRFLRLWGVGVFGPD
jgi:hypothetical protein